MSWRGFEKRVKSPTRLHSGRDDCRRQRAATPDRKDQLEGESLPVKKAPANFLVVKRFESLRPKHDKVRNEFDAY